MGEGTIRRWRHGHAVDGQDHIGQIRHLHPAGSHGLRGGGKTAVYGLGQKKIRFGHAWADQAEEHGGNDGQSWHQMDATGPEKGISIHR